MTSLSGISPNQPLSDDAALLDFAKFLHDGVPPRWRTLWFVMLDGERRALPVIVPVDHVPDEPDVRMVNELGHAWREMLHGEPGASIMLMLERPGSAVTSSEDHAWGVALRAAAAEHDLAVAGFFLATTDGVVAHTLD